MAAQPPTFWLKISFSSRALGACLLPLIISDDADARRKKRLYCLRYFRTSTAEDEQTLWEMLRTL
jgi:hypothetical protein